MLRSSLPLKSLVDATTRHAATGTDAHMKAASVVRTIIHVALLDLFAFPRLHQVLAIRSACAV